MTGKAYQILQRPLLTEKGTTQKESFNKLFFQVDRRANKIEIKQAVEQIFKVDVVSVTTLIMSGKVKRVGRMLTKRPDWKKAVVTIKPGQQVKFFEGA
ncbi:MAG TPA: 50S ribosomal protein L23 [Syntrophobacteraceae bacterium]|nr:50S ribosomal protein L23 [Syntrophobacteraceae bacterium]HBD07899.1 50S ribosomal protein L23 [Syntrophobacteraceae bacterium]HBZ56290.1 50S ribosomal protein L23 [Syntrophobacteraceae bacterium]